ncbi:MAG: MinD/ParA family protein [Methanoregulaceae archaeon]|jgi:MinD-like ATPase involved in chromosome partitioning or flagellar assembly|nr:MinD/ParA family protein [Methanoregulaceae archaeon]
MKIITTHSFRGGTGKTNITANLSYALAITGKRVAVVDADATHPSLHITFGLGENPLSPTFAEFLLQRCKKEDIIHDISEQYGLKNSLFLIPSKLDDTVIHELYGINQDSFHIGNILNGLKEIGEDNKIDYLLIDTKPDLDERALLYFMASQAVLVITRPDETDIRGTKELLKRISGIPQRHIHIIPNMVPARYLKERVETFRKEFAGFDSKRVKISEPILYSQVLQQEHSPKVDQLFIRRYPQDDYSQSIFHLATTILKLYPSV